MISISIFRINAKNRTIWYNLIQTSVPLVYTNYFYNIYCPNMGGSRGGDFQNLFFKIITSLANIFSNLFSPQEILGFFFISIQVFILFM